MFADDTNISITTKSVTELEPLINSELQNVHQWLTANRLSLNVAKTEFRKIGSRQRLLVHNDEQINIQIDGKAIKRVNETKSLCLQIDEHLTCEPTMVNEVLVTTEQCCGTSYLKIYGQYALFNSKEKLTTYLSYGTDSCTAIL